MPVCLNNDWRIVSFDLDTNYIKYYDSLYENDTNLILFAKNFIVNYIKRCLPNNLNSDK